MGGEYKAQLRGLRAAVDAPITMGSSRLQMLKQASTRETADALLERSEQAQMARTDVNDLLYQIESSSDYDPYPDIGRIVAPMTAVNSADYSINPPKSISVAEDVRRAKGAESSCCPAPT